MSTQFNIMIGIYPSLPPVSEVDFSLLTEEVATIVSYPYYLVWDWNIFI